MMAKDKNEDERWIYLGPDLRAYWQDKRNRMASRALAMLAPRGGK